VLLLNCSLLTPWQYPGNMPLVMRIDKRIKRTATDIVNKEDEKSLADLNYEFSLDRASRLIARFIVRETELHYVF
jgi:16S rRNA C1402 N4-methylase RsmH